MFEGQTVQPVPISNPGVRPLRVLHIGNIANNAYLNAKFLNAAGLDCDVICYNYYHIMGCPEWEEADFNGDVGDHFTPQWWKIDLRGYRRPHWFAQGPVRFCAKYLVAKRAGHKGRACLWWAVLKATCYASGSRTARSCYRLFKRMVRSIQDRTGVLGAKPVHPPGGHTPALPPEEMAPWGKNPGLWNRLFSYYDIVQAYSTDPIIPFAHGHRRFVAYEHGTIRNIPFEDNTVGRLTALAYREASAVVITNCDNIKAAKALGLRNYRFIPHPVNEPQLGDDAELDALRQRIGRELNADFVVFHPARQHWEPRRHPDWEKGNDIFVRGLARFVKEVRPRAGAVFVRWGQKVAETEALLRELGIADRVLWVEPQPGIRMARYIRACDLVADQFFLGAFGSTLPKALACGRACMIYLNEEVHRWCFPEPPPVLNARTPEEVFQQLSRFAADAGYRRELEERGLQWYRRYHSAGVIVSRHMEMYREVLAGQTPPGETGPGKQGVVRA